MQAIVLEQFGGVEHLYARELPLPEPGPGQVRVRIRAVSVNPVDWKMRQGRPGLAVPLVLGRDFAGTVHALGPGAAGFQVGEAVFGALLGPRSNGSYAQYACAPAAFLAHRPAALSFAQAAALPVAALTAYECLVLKARLRAGEALFIAGGSGGVGSLAIPLARRLGAAPILTTAGSADSAEFLVRELGVEPRHILRYAGLSLEQMQAAVLAMHGGRPLPVALDLVGGAMKRLCCQVLDYDGHLVTIVEESPDFDLAVWSAQH
ncbi:MAG TPA: NADP-dependent oxidoreductase, partial [bacterium]|nr:NADP-dependent oxidoreductase [bacterium]